jgi:hypothetical protein
MVRVALQGFAFVSQQPRSVGDEDHCCAGHCKNATPIVCVAQLLMLVALAAANLPVLLLAAEGVIVLNCLPTHLVANVKLNLNYITSAPAGMSPPPPARAATR